MSHTSFVFFSTEQECIPVGCVPSAAVAIWEGVSARGGGVSTQGGLPGWVFA